MVLGSDLMKILRQLTIIFACLFAGVIISSFIDFPIPETIYGMVILFVLLVTKRVKLESVDETGSMLANNIAFWIAPSTIAIVNVYSQIQVYIVKIIIITFISTILTILATAYTIKLVRRYMNVSK